MTSFEGFPDINNSARAPVPLDGAMLRGGNLVFVGPEGDWNPKDLDAYTSPMLAVPGERHGVDVTVAEDPESTQPELPALPGRDAAIPRTRRVRREIINGKVVETPVWEPAQPARPNANKGRDLWDAARVFSLGVLATTVTLVGIGGYVLFSKTGVSAPNQPGRVTLVGKSSPSPANTPGATATPGKTPTPKPTPTTQPPTQTPPTPTPQPPAPKPKAAEWGETVDAQTYDSNGNAQGTLTGDQTNMFACQTPDGQYDQLQSPPQGDGPYVKAKQVQLVNGPNSLPICGTASTSSATTGMASLQLNNSVIVVWQSRGIKQPSA